MGHLTEELRIERVRIEDGRIELAPGVSVPLDPMVGCLGVAPAEAVGSTMRPVYPSGGNMDLREMRAGAIAWLPVFAPGAQLSVGDLHAAMGQGEATAVALEAAGTAVLRIDLEKQRGLELPRLRYGNTTFLMGLGDSDVESRQQAMAQALQYVIEELGLEPFAAYSYLSACVDVRFGGPAGPTVLAAVPDLELREKSG